MSMENGESGALVIYPPRSPNATDPIVPYPNPAPGVHYVGMPQSAFTAPLTRDPTRQNAAVILADPIAGEPYETLVLRLNDRDIVRQFVPPQDQNSIVQLHLPQAEVDEGLSVLQLRYQRGSGNFEDSVPLGLQYHRNLPGGNNVPGTGDHPALKIDWAPQSDEPPHFGADEFNNGQVQLTLDYPYKRPYDTLKVELNNVPFYFQVQPGEEHRPYVIVVSLQMYIAAGKPAALNAAYTVTDQLGNTTDKRRWSKKVFATVDPLDAELHVLGARVAAIQYWANKGASRYLSAIDRKTFSSLTARWRYEGDNDDVATAQFDDIHPDRFLHVRYGAQNVTVRPANFFGNGYCNLDNYNEPHSAFAALNDDGTITSWGVQTNGGSPVSVSGVKTVAWSLAAFAALKNDGSVVAWGDPRYGGQVPANIAGLRDIKQLFTGGRAIAALRNDNSVVAWGEAANGGTVPAAIGALKNIRAVYGSATAFVAHLTDGSVRAWGDAVRGGVLPASIANLRNIVEVVNNHDAFAARLSDDSVVAWGFPGSGGTVPQRIDNVSRIVSAGYAFAAHLESGHVRTWGKSNWGGTAPAAILALDNIVDIVGAGYAFAAILSDRRVVAWGDPDQGGVVPTKIAALRNIVQLAATNGAYAALCADGSLVTWGNAVWGGDSSQVTKRLKNVVAIYSNSEAFVALTATGNVITCGLRGSGGFDSAAEYELMEEISYLSSMTSQYVRSETPKGGVSG
ncbi:RCC1 domain-containing protein [Pseudomonas sp. Eth.TT006]